MVGKQLEGGGVKRKTAAGAEESAHTEGHRFLSVLLLYLRVLPVRLLLEVWGGRGNGRKLSSQDGTHRPPRRLREKQFGP